MRRLAFLLAISPSLILSACDGSSASNTILNFINGRVSSVGPVQNANVEVYAAGDNGAPQRLLGSTTTAANGTFQLSVEFDGWTLVKAWGGTFVDADSGSPSTIPEATPHWGVARSATSPGAPAIITRASTMLTMDAQEMARDPGMSFGDAIATAARKLEAITSVPDVHLTVPADLSAGPVSNGPAARYGALLAAYSVFAGDLGVSGPELGHAAARDGKDGKFDGLEYLDQIEVAPSIDLQPGFLTSLFFCVQLWLNTSPRNMSGLVLSDMPEFSAMTAASNMMPVTPRVQSVWSGHSPLAGGNDVTLRGWGFGMTPIVRIGSMDVTPTTATDTEIVFETPAAAVAGDVDIEISTALVGGYTYKALAALRYYDEDAAPVVTDVEPDEGPIAGGTPVRITGMNLDPSTRVFFGADEALVSGGTFPREIVAYAPKVATEGARDLRVENGAGESVTLTARYDYKKKDVGRTFDQSYFDGPFTAIFQKWDYDGADFRATIGTTAWQLNGAGQGSFTRTETTMTAAGTTEASYSGSAFATAEGQNGQVLTLDMGTNLTNLYAFTIRPDGQLGAGLTAGGTTAVFEHGSGLDAMTLRGRYGAVGSYVHTTPELTFGTGAGTIEFDGAGAGGLNMKVYERDALGTTFRQYTLVMPLTYDVTSEGELDVQLDPGAALSWDLRGRTTTDGSFASFYYAGTGGWQGRSAAFKVVRLESGVAPEDYRGEYDGGYMTEKTFDDGVDVYPKVTAFLSNRLLETSGLDSRHYAANDGGSLGPNGIDRIYQTGRVSDRYLGQSGRLEHADGSVAGYFTPRLGVSISAGKVAETVGNASLSDRAEYGFGVRFDAHYSKWSISGAHNLLSWESRWLNPGVVPTTGDESNQTQIGSVTFNPAKPVTIGAKPFSLFGGFDSYSVSTKTVDRVGLSATASFGGTPDLQAEFAYGFTGDRLHYVLAEREDLGPLGGFRAGLTLGKGALSPSGAAGAFGSTSKYDRTSFTAFAPFMTWTLGDDYRFGALLADFDGTTGATNMRVERGTLSTPGSIGQSYMQQLFVEGGSPSTSSGVRTGTYTSYPDGKVDFNLGGQVFGGFGIGDADMFLLTDFSSSTQTGIQVLVKDSLAAPPLGDLGMMSLQKLFSGAALPAPTSVFLRAGTYTPQSNLISLIALDQVRSNDAAGTALGRQFNTGTASTTASGGFNFGLGTAQHSGAMSPDGCFGFGLPGADTEAPTSMSLGIFFRF